MNKRERDKAGKKGGEREERKEENAGGGRMGMRDEEKGRRKRVQFKKGKEEEYKRSEGKTKVMRAVSGVIGLRGRSVG